MAKDAFDWIVDNEDGCATMKQRGAKRPDPPKPSAKRPDAPKPTPLPKPKRKK